MKKQPSKFSGMLALVLLAIYVGSYLAVRNLSHQDSYSTGLPTQKFIVLGAWSGKWRDAVSRGDGEELNRIIEGSYKFRLFYTPLRWIDSKITGTAF